MPTKLMAGKSNREVASFCKDAGMLKLGGANIPCRQGSGNRLIA
jgi:hypothetical protein